MTNGPYKILFRKRIFFQVILRNNDFAANDGTYGYEL